MNQAQELIAAIKQADLNSVEKLIKEEVNLNYKDDDQDSYGLYWTPLHHCVFKGGSSQSGKYTDMAALLLQNGAAIESVNYTGETPVLFAVKYYALDIVDLLVKSGANIYAVNNEKQNAFDVVLDRYYYDQRLDEDHIGDEEDETVKAAIQKGEGQSLTYMFKRIDALVKNGYDLNAGKYSTALCALFEIEQKKLPAKALYYLFDKGANPREYITTKEGDLFPMFEGAVRRKLPVEILVEMAKRIGLNYAFEQFANYTPLLFAILHDNIALVKSLIALGADIHFQDDRPLRVACNLGKQEITEYLVEQGAIVNFVDQHGNTPIAYAEKGGFTEIVDYLKSKM